MTVVLPEKGLFFSGIRKGRQAKVRLALQTSHQSTSLLLASGFLLLYLYHLAFNSEVQGSCAREEQGRDRKSKSQLILLHLSSKQLLSRDLTSDTWFTSYYSKPLHSNPELREYRGRWVCLTSNIASPNKFRYFFEGRRWKRILDSQQVVVHTCKTVNQIKIVPFIIY